MDAVRSKNEGLLYRATTEASMLLGVPKLSYSHAYRGEDIGRKVLDINGTLSLAHANFDFGRTDNLITSYVPLTMGEAVHEVVHGLHRENNASVGKSYRLLQQHLEKYIWRAIVFEHLSKLKQSYRDRRFDLGSLAAVVSHGINAVVNLKRPYTNLETLTEVVNDYLNAFMTFSISTEAVAYSVQTLCDRTQTLDSRMHTKPHTFIFETQNGKTADDIARAMMSQCSNCFSMTSEELQDAAVKGKIPETLMPRQMVAYQIGLTLGESISDDESVVPSVTVNEVQGRTIEVTLDYPQLSPEETIKKMRTYFHMGVGKLAQLAIETMEREFSRIKTTIEDHKHGLTYYS